MTSANPWTKFFWNDWENDPALRLCSLSAQGLWMRLLCIAAKANPTGFVVIAGRPCASTDISRLTGVSEQEVESLLDELSQNGVFSRDAQSRIYCRRMVRDSRKSAKLRQNGAKGGQASVRKGKGIFAQSEQNTEPPDEQGADPQKPESRVHKRKTPEGPPVDRGRGRRESASTAEVSPLDVGWNLPDEWRELAVDRGWSETAIMRQAGKFKNYFAFGRGVEIKRGVRGWKQTWVNWLKRELRSNPDAATFGKADKSGKVPPSYPPLPEPIRSKLQGHYQLKGVVIKRWLEPCLFDLEAGVITAPTRFHADYLEGNYGAALEHVLGCQFSYVVGKTHAQAKHTEEGKK